MESRRSSALDYVAPTYTEATQYSERRTSTYDSLILPTGPKYFKARGGPNQIRILPPTWGGARHYSYEVKVHNDVGASRQQYLCLAQEGSPDRHCPLCEARNEPGLTQDEKDKLRAKSRNYIYLIDRHNQGLNVLLWSISTQSDKEILSQSLIKRTQEYLPIANVHKGYDIDFHREGEGLATRYRGFMVSRESTPLSTDPSELRQWVDYIDNHPIPEILQFFPAAHIQAVFTGHSESGSRRATSSRDEREGNGRDDRRDGNGRDDRIEARRPPLDSARNAAPSREPGEDEDAPPWNEESDDRRSSLNRRLDHDRR